MPTFEAGLWLFRAHWEHDGYGGATTYMVATNFEGAMRLALVCKSRGAGKRELLQLDRVAGPIDIIEGFDE
jgi:hypothetical protein